MRECFIGLCALLCVESGGDCLSIHMKRTFINGQIDSINPVFHSSISSKNRGWNMICSEFFGLNYGFQMISDCIGLSYIGHVKQQFFDH
jgi:hypothetical protein